MTFGFLLLMVSALGHLVSGLEREGLVLVAATITEAVRDACSAAAFVQKAAQRTLHRRASL